MWPRGATVSTLGSESSGCGSNPREAFIYTLRLERMNLNGFIALPSFLWKAWFLNSLRIIKKEFRNLLEIMSLKTCSATCKHR